MLDFLIEFGDYLLLVINHLNYVCLLVAGFLEMFEVLKPAQLKQVEPFLDICIDKLRPYGSLFDSRLQFFLCVVDRILYRIDFKMIPASGNA